MIATYSDCRVCGYRFYGFAYAGEPCSAECAEKQERMNTHLCGGVVNGPKRDDENVSAFAREETVSTYRFLWNGIKAALILLGSVALFAAIAITIWKATQ